MAHPARKRSQISLPRRRLRALEQEFIEEQRQEIADGFAASQILSTEIATFQANRAKEQAEKEAGTPGSPPAVSNKDARSLAPMLHIDAAVIESQPKGSFASYVRGVTKAAVPLSFPFGVLESEPRMSAHERGKLQELMRARYAVHYSELDQFGPDGPDAPAAQRVEKETAAKASNTPQAGHINTDAGSDW